MIGQYQLHIQTPGRATIDVTTEIEQLVRKSGINSGLCHLFIHHTSAPLMITVNADSHVRRDLENYQSNLVLHVAPTYLHAQDAPDELAVHIRSVLTQNEISIPICDGVLALGTWQGIFLWEHRIHPHQRKLTVTCTGNKETIL